MLAWSLSGIRILRARDRPLLAVVAGLCWAGVCRFGERVRLLGGSFTLRLACFEAGSLVLANLRTIHAVACSLDRF